MLMIRLPNELTIHVGGASQASAVARRVLESSRTFVPSWVQFIMHSATVASAAVSAALSDHPHHQFAELIFVDGERQQQELDRDGTRPRLVAVDGTNLCAAVLRCPSAVKVHFESLHFNAAAAVADVRRVIDVRSTTSSAHNKVGDGATSSPSPIATVDSLGFRNCTFGKGGTGPAVGVCDVAIAMSRRDKLRHLQLYDTALDMSDVKVLCGMLRGSEHALAYLHLGDTKQDAEPCLGRDEVLYFFRHLPFTQTLRVVRFRYVAPASASRAIAAGIKNNCSLLRLEGLVFEADNGPESSGRLTSEVDPYLSANLSGRAAFADAVADLDCIESQVLAVALLQNLSESTQPGSVTSTYLCLRLFLPSYATARNATSAEPPTRAFSMLRVPSKTGFD